MTDTRVIDERSAPVTDGLAVQVRGLRMSYGSTEVLRGVDFDVRYGEVFCLLGPNGAGKTTTLEILEGFRPPTGGTVRVLGLNPATQAARLRERVGMVLQECGFPRQARVAELIAIWRSYYPNPRPLGELLDVVELAEVRNTQVRKLSVGQRRRLDFALALAGDPDLVFLDEPTTGFDPEARRRCWAAIENLRRLGTTIVLTTHYLDEAERLADRIAILQAGRIELAGTTCEVAARAGLATRVSFTTPSALRRGQVALPDGVGLAVRGPRRWRSAGTKRFRRRRRRDFAADIGRKLDDQPSCRRLDRRYTNRVAYSRSWHTEPRGCLCAGCANSCRAAVQRVRTVGVRLHLAGTQGVGTYSRSPRTDARRRKVRLAAESGGRREADPKGRPLPERRRPAPVPHGPVHGLHRLVRRLYPAAL